MDRQPLTDRLGDRLLAEYGGAAAAYSLRALNGNGDSVVRVRRASDNDEEDFTAEQIELGEMVNWVNSQIVPPLDIGVLTPEGRIPVPEGGTSIGIPAAAYSLRNLSTTYTGNVVDVRRSIDDAVESFTAAEVADGTLEAWVLAPVSSFIGNKMWFDDVDDYVSFGDVFDYTDTFSIHAKILTKDAGISVVAARWDTFGSAGRQYLFRLNGGVLQFFDSASTLFARGSGLNDGQAHDIELVVNGASSYLAIDGVQSGAFFTPSITNRTSSFLSGATFNTSPSIGVQSLGLIYDLSITKDGSPVSAYTGTELVTWTDQIGSNDGTVNGSPELFTGQGYDGFVSKWYDQSGNDNHATQGTDASQPKIVNGGSLVTNNGNAVVNFQSIDDRHFIFGAGIDLTARTVFYAGRPASTNFQNLLGNTSNSSTNYIRTLNNVAGRPWETEPSSSIFVDGSAYAGGDVSDQGYSLNTFVFDSDATVNFLGGTGAAISDTPIVDASEIIIYPSDQSANRTAIEANIGETYGITGIPAYDNTVDGFVETWYDQSGNGNDAVQSVAGSQPKIVDGGSLVSGGIDFDGVDDYLLSSHILSSDDVLSLYAVGAFDDLTQRVRMVADFFYVNVLDNGGFVLENNAFSQSGRIAGYGDDTLFPHNAASFVTEGSESLFELQLASGSSSFYVNGSNVNTISATMNAEDGGSVLSIGGGTTGGFPFIGPIKEIILYNADKTSDMANIRGNINDHYNIY
jgi:hypothetical protein